MEINILAFGIAKEILDAHTLKLKVGTGSSIREIKDVLKNQYPGFQKLASFRLAVNEEYRDDDYKVKEQDEVVIIPPVSGG